MPKLLLAFLLMFSIGHSQQPEVVSVKTDERIFNGFVDKYPITMALKVHTFSNRHDSIYSVKGWYMYDNKQIKIPLVGIYDGDLTLYNFSTEENDTGLEDDILALGNNWGGSIWDRLDLLKMTGSQPFGERFIFTDSATTQSHEYSGYWSNRDRELTAKLTSSKGLRIYDGQEYLAFPDEKITSLDLHKLDIFETGFRFESWKKDTDEIRVLLYYTRHSTPNAMGMCGGSNESGFVVLHLDKDLKFVSFEKTPVESCLDSLTAEISGKNSEIYTVTNEKRQKKKLRIDRKNAKIITLSS